MELRDLYDENRKLIGKTIKKDEETPDNCYILMVVAFIENLEGKYLIQKRSEAKGGQWSFTGGHPKHGETSLDGVKQEIKEELGIAALNPIVFKSVKGNNVFCDLYYINQDINLDDIVKQDEEVADVMFATKDEIDALLANGQFKKGHYMMFEDFLKFKNVDF